MKNDHSFDGLAGKFSKNIYGTTKGRLRHALLLNAMNDWLPATDSPIIELGSGTGEMALSLSERGYAMTLTDPSTDVLSQAASLLSAYPATQFIQKPLQQLSSIGDYSFIVCHAVLEWLVAPMEALSYIYEKMQSGSTLSLSFFNRDAALFNNAVYGNFDYIARDMKVKKQVRLNPKQPLSPPMVIEHCKQTGFTICAMTGIRCFHDYIRDREMQNSHFEDILALEKQYGSQEPFCRLGRYFHLILKK
ncbi:methyltransferase domain-containing protein [Alteromonas antoniana]|uniref:methyltransferase domain-containing protein n=1 Tax=Alteromonas antoniana TaxID=2803813 RepID=UPI001C45D5ED|nr:methyltransferase domain-containing protein [Alteromonas antoniana]